jgi:hypothetical protein
MECIITKLSYILVFRTQKKEINKIFNNLNLIHEIKNCLSSL